MQARDRGVRECHHVSNLIKGKLEFHWPSVNFLLEIKILNAFEIVFQILIPHCTIIILVAQMILIKKVN